MITGQPQYVAALLELRVSPMSAIVNTISAWLVWVPTTVGSGVPGNYADCCGTDFLPRVSSEYSFREISSLLKIDNIFVADRSSRSKRRSDDEANEDDSSYGGDNYGSAPTTSPKQILMEGLGTAVQEAAAIIGQAVGEVVSGKINQTMDAGAENTDNDPASRSLSTERYQAPDSMKGGSTGRRQKPERW